MEINNNYNYNTDAIYSAYSSNICYQVNKPNTSTKRVQTERKEYIPELTDADIDRIIENYKKRYQEAQKKRKKRRGWLNAIGFGCSTILPIGTVADKILDFCGTNVLGIGEVKSKVKNEQELRRYLKNLQLSIKNINDQLNSPYMSENERQRFLTALENFVEIEEDGNSPETPNKKRGLDNYREQVEKLKAGDVDAFQFDSDNSIRLAASLERNIKKVESETNLKLMTETDAYAYAYWTGNIDEIQRLRDKDKEDKNDR